MRPREYLLRGDILKCGCCGYALVYDDSMRNIVYRCNHTLANTNAECHKMKLDAAELDDVVLVIIRKQAEVVLNTSDLTKLGKVSTDGKQIADYENEIRKCVEQRQQAYEQFVLQEIDRETHKSLSKECSERISRLNSNINILRQAARDRQSSLKTAAIAKHILNESTSPREIVETLIDKVLVSPSKNIEIQWKIADFTII